VRKKPIQKLIKVGILFTNYGPYHIARVKAARDIGQDLAIEVVGIELARYSSQYPWKVNLNSLNFELTTVCSGYKYEGISLHHLIFNIFKLLNKINPDILALSGYSEIGMITAFIWAKIYAKKTILFSESKEDDASRVFYKELIKKFIISFYDAAIVGGNPHRRYLEKLGMGSNAIFLGYDVIQNNDFTPAIIRQLSTPIQNPYFLTINRFIPKKNLIFLITAYAKYLKTIDISLAWDLVICGDGELRSQIEQKIDELNLQNHVHLTGFLQQEQMLPYFAHAKCFIHASVQEQWGLVVNEAMAAGLPVIASKRCGCYEDLIIEGANGFGFDPENSQELTDLMLKVSSADFDLQKMGITALEHIQKFSPEYFAQGLIKAVDYALTHSIK